MDDEYGVRKKERKKTGFRHAEENLTRPDPRAEMELAQEARAIDYTRPYPCPYPHPLTLRRMRMGAMAMATVRRQGDRQTKPFGNQSYVVDDLRRG
jgi:hypothetical protein